MLMFYSEHTKKLLVECTASHLKHKDCAAAYGSGLTSSSGRILLQSIPGELCNQPMPSGVFSYYLFCKFNDMTC